MSEWSGKSRGNALGYWFFIFFMRNLGMGFTYGFLHFVVLYFFLFSWSSSKWIYRYYRQGLGYGWWKSMVNIYKTYYVFGQVIIDKVAMASGIKDRFNLTHNGAEIIRDMVENKTGGILISGHMGNWEIASHLMRGYGGVVNVVMYDEEHQKIKKHIDETTGMPIADFSFAKVNYFNKDSVQASSFTIVYDKSYPHQLEVGMKLPDIPTSYTVMSMNAQITFPREKVLSVRNENRWVGNSANPVAFNFGKQVKTTLTEYITANIESIGITEAFLKNREVKEKKEVTVSGKTYTAYMIREEAWTGSPMWTVTSDDEWVQKKNQNHTAKGQKAVEDLLKKNENANEQGYIVTATESWWIPDIGAYSMTSFDAWGSKVGYLELKEIR